MALFRRGVEGKFKVNVSRLRKAMKGEANQLVCYRLKYSSDANAIMNSLFVIYEFPYCHLWTRQCPCSRSDLAFMDLLSLPRLDSKSGPKIGLWAVKVNGYVTDVRSMNMEENLTNGYVMTNLASNLGDS